MNPIFTQSVEDFIKTYFTERTAEIQRELEARQPFREKFFVDDCFWDSRSSSIAESLSETIIEIHQDDDRGEVITQVVSSFPRRRYILQKTETGWLIERVDIEYKKEFGWIDPSEGRNYGTRTSQP